MSVTPPFYPARSVLPPPPPSSPPMPGYNRSASLAITLFGAVLNGAIAIQVLATWRSLKWEPESEWEASGDNWQVDGVKIIWGLLSAYFASAATVCAVGFVGIIKNKPSFLRFYRDYSIADFSFCTFFTAVTTYAAFHTAARAAVCEELSHHPELMRDMLEMGLNLENCERWLERAVLAFIVVMVVIIVVRLHFLLAVSNLYSQLIRKQQSPSVSRSHSRSSITHQRIFLLPPSSISPMLGDDVELVYAPVPLSSLTKDVRASATEAWLSRNSPRSDARHSRTSSLSALTSELREQQQEQQEQRPHRHRHSHSHSHHRRQASRSSSATRTGRICLPILPDEGLLPSYYGAGGTKA